MSAADIERAREALQHINPGISRKEWHEVGRAAIAAGLTVDDLVEWSRPAANFKSEQDVRASFRTIASNGKTQSGTLFHVAKQHGWKPRQNGRTKPIAPPTAPAPARREKTAQTPDLAACWASWPDADAGHPYIVAKNGTPEGLKVVPDDSPLTIAGHRVAGWLAIPARNNDGELQSAQFIPPPGQGKKLNMPRASMAGARFIVGKPLPDAPIYLCEGIGAAWACWQATGNAAACCFGWGNVERVADGLRQKARLVIVPDVGKEEAAAEIAQKYGCAVAKLPEGLPVNFDANDYAQAEDADELRAILEAAKQPEPPPPLLLPVSVADVIACPSAPPRFIWEGFLPRGEVALLGAHGGTGKSTIALMLAVAVATGRELFGHATEQAPALFLSLEDGAAIVRHRLRHICQQWGIDPAALAEWLRVADGTATPELFTAEGRGDPGGVTPTYAELFDLAESCRAGLIVIDNASDAYGGDEIYRRHVRAFIRSLATIARKLDAAALLLSHIDKSTSRAGKAENNEGYSGSTAWNNSVRSRLFMHRASPNWLEIGQQKSNHGPLQKPLRLHWPEGGLPESAENPAIQALVEKTQARADDAAAVEILRLLAEFEGRQQFASPARNANNNPCKLLSAEPAFKRLGLNRADVQRIIDQCQRAGWLEIVEYRHDRKERQRWGVTDKGKTYASIDEAEGEPQ